MALASLPLFHRVAGEKVVVLGDGDAADTKRRIVERAGATCVGEPEAHHAKLAFIAIDDPREAEAAGIRLRCRGLLVNVTDTPALCDFTVPSLLDRDPVLIAVGTGGASAGLAKMLRLRLERMLPQGLGRLAMALRDARDAIRARWPGMDDRRRALDAAMREGGPLDPMQSHVDGAVDRWLSGETEKAETGIREIALRSLDPDDLSLRQARWLGSADVVIHDRTVPDAILERARADAVRRVAADDLEQEAATALVVVVREPGANNSGQAGQKA